MPYPKAILWDMDRILADTSQLHFQSWERVLTQQGIPFDREKFHQIYGLKNQDFLPHLAGRPLEPHWIQQIADEKELVFRQSIRGQLKPLPGVVDWLRRFKAWGCRQAVASSAPPENVDVQVDEMHIRQYFDALVTPGDQPGKPDPAVFLKASQQLKVPTAACLVIEDSLPGIEAARKAGMCCIALANTNPPEALSQADVVVLSLDQLTASQVEALFP